MSYTKTPAAQSYIQLMIGTTLTNIPGVKGIPEFGPEKVVYENTSISDTARTYGTDLPDPGEIPLVLAVDLRDSTHLQMSNNAANISSTDQFKVVYHSGTNVTFNAKVLSFRMSAEPGGDEMATVRLKLTGAISVTAAT